MSKQLRNVSWLTVTCTAMTVTAFVIAYAHRGRPSSTSIATASADMRGHPLGRDKTITPAVTENASGAVQVVRFVVYAEGIKPAEAQVAAGPVAVYVEDLGGISDGLIVKDGRGLGLGRVSRSEGKGRGSQRLNLKPGEYRVFDATRPQNYATLIAK